MTGIDLSELWVSVWNNKTHGLKASPINDALQSINHDIVNGCEPVHCVIAVLPSLNDCLNYNRVIKRILKAKTETKKGDDENDNRDQRTEGERENDGGKLSATEN